jgi:hypothetical protein
MPVVPSTSGFIAPCIPIRAPKPPVGPGWVHEIKHDGYRLQVRREGEAVRLFTRRGYDWSGRYPAIAVTATLLRARSFTLDGEAVVCGPDGVAIFDALHRRGTVTEAMLYAFDLLELDGEDLRGLPLGDRLKAADCGRNRSNRRTEMLYDHKIRATVPSRLHDLREHDANHVACYCGSYLCHLVFCSDRAAGAVSGASKSATEFRARRTRRCRPTIFWWRLAGICRGD